MAGQDLKIDPGWAWDPFVPDKKNPWSRRHAAHLYRRAGFGAPSATLDEAVRLGLSRTIKQLVSSRPAAGGFDREMASMARSITATGKPQQLSAWWLYRMVTTPDQVLEKTTLFWHGHFATSAAKVEEPQMMLAQNSLLRRHALGRFESMVQGMSRDPAMLIWLDSTTNRRIRPNENYARELLELFCLGLGNYTEKDIAEIARAFTGWEVVNGRFVFSAFQHDTGNKVFLGANGNYGGDEAIRIVLGQPAAARFIARKLVHFFVCEEPSLPDAVIEPLAKQLASEGFELRPVVSRILASNIMFSRHAVGRKVRSPVELAVGLLRCLEGTADMFKLAEALERIGQGVFFPPSVKGWDGGRTWIDSASLLGRANLVRHLVVDGGDRFGKSGLRDLVEQHGRGDPQDTIDWLLEMLVAVPIPPKARQLLVDLARSRSAGANDRWSRVIHAISTIPEFQLC